MNRENLGVRLISQDLIPGFDDFSIDDASDLELKTVMGNDKCPDSKKDETFDNTPQETEDERTETSREADNVLKR